MSKVIQVLRHRAGLELSALGGETTLFPLNPGAQCPPGDGRGEAVGVHAGLGTVLGGEAKKPEEGGDQERIPPRGLGGQGPRRAAGGLGWTVRAKSRGPRVTWRVV